MVDLVFDAPANITDFFDILGYFNNLTDVGAGGMFWTIMLVVFAGMLWMMMKSYSVEKATGITTIVTAIIAFLFRLMGWVNDYVVTVCVILGLLGLTLLVMEKNRNE